MAEQLVEPLLKGKLRIPSVREMTVARHNLLARLDSAPRYGLTLISAPAGYGKTTLLSSWAAQCRLPVAWLSLDEQDNDPARFAAYLGAALDGVQPLDPQKAGLLRAASTMALETVLAILMDHLEQADGAVVLALDDYHLIQAPPIHSAVTYLLEHLPSHLHVAIATRTDPPIPLARLRMNGEMLELRLDDLRFSLEEAEVFLKQRWKLDLSAAEIAALEARTEGWAAGLQMAALSLQGRPDASTFIQSFAGSHRFVLDYLLEEVITRQPAAVQEFLLRTSILERLCAPLCDALVAPEGESEGLANAPGSAGPSAALLEHLDRSNLFLIPLDDYRCWFRYHHLFADLLRARLKGQVKDAGLAALHLRAARWCAANGLPEEAIHHALAAQDWHRAVELIKAHQYDPESFKRGNPTQLLEWLQAMPQEVPLKDPQLAIGYGWALALTGALEPAEQALAAAQAANRDDPDGLGDALAGLAYVARSKTELPLAAGRAKEALALLPAENAWMRSVAAMTLGLAEWAMGDLAACEAAMRIALREAERSQGERTRATALCYLGRLKALDLDLQQAEPCWQRALPEEDDPRLAPSGDIAYFDMAALLYERNDLERAASCLSRGFEANRTSRNPDIGQLGYRTLARLRLARGDLDGASQALQKADEVAQSAGLGPFARNLTAACHVRAALASGDLASAEAWAGRIEGDAGLDAFCPIPRLAVAELWLAKGDGAAARQCLEGLARRAERPGWRMARLRVGLLQCLAAANRAEARRRLLGCLLAARPQGLVRPFLDLGAPMEALLRATRPAAEGPARPFVDALLSCFAGGGVAPRPSGGARSAPGGQAAAGLVEPLTERELQVLRGLAQGLSNREIAEAQYVAVSTVKSHAKSIFGKLGVDSRGKAVRRAQELGLL